MSDRTFSPGDLLRLKEERDAGSVSHKAFMDAKKANSALCQHDRVELIRDWIGAYVCPMVFCLDCEMTVAESDVIKIARANRRETNET